MAPGRHHKHEDEDRGWAPLAHARDGAARGAIEGGASLTEWNFEWIASLNGFPLFEWIPKF